MAATDVEIFNLALNTLGVEEIGSFADGSVQAIAGGRVYALARDAMLDSSDWIFAYEKNKTLTVDAAAPPGGDAAEWQFQFTLPPDLRTIKKVHDGHFPIQYLPVANRKIFTLQDTNVFVDYIRDAAVTTFTQLFVDALAYDLAQRVAMTLTADRDLFELTLTLARQKMLIAQNREAYQRPQQGAGRYDLNR